MKRESENTLGDVLGVDLGSSSISAVLIDSSKRVLETRYFYHQGQIIQGLKRVLRDLKSNRPFSLGTTEISGSYFNSIPVFNQILCEIQAAKHLHPDLKTLLSVGAEKFSLSRFGEEGSYLETKRNTSCACGTGSFLDQQSKRLGLKNSAELSDLALGNTGSLPTVASRCAVFAKTDLIHCQQEGYNQAEICDGLCLGLARSLSDTLLGGEAVQEPLVICGGVSLNQAVVKHLSQIWKVSPITDTYSPLYGALGAALLTLEQIEKDAASGEITSVIQDPVDYIRDDQDGRLYHFPPLNLTLSDYPDFSSTEKLLFYPERARDNPVEVDFYKELSREGDFPAYLGLDIGSTSTKSVITDLKGEPLIGLYTRTAGKPVLAVQNLLEVVQKIERDKGVRFVIYGLGTTGSGRKFAGTLFGADRTYDEITAHARAAFQLNPDIDTIIEIGGQDSKFTTLKNGLVTFCRMNTVCAAGTGSFLEEQAHKLGVKLEDYSHLAEGNPAPMTSDRCTVFMERDLNVYQNKQYKTGEILAAVLHGVRENYLHKVVQTASLGRVICFQGATAKNRALVASFEQKLGKPIFVSPYCHLTGALGAALLLKDEGIEDTRFKGLEVWQEEISLREERCNLCANSCRIRIANLKGEEVAFGFLCGRDYNTNHYVNSNKSGFDPFRERQRVFENLRIKNSDVLNHYNPIKKVKSELKHLKGKAATAFSKEISPLCYFPTLGLPASLQVGDYLSFWKRFFTSLGFKVITSESFKEGVSLGKRVSGAEFCSPIQDYHGHVAELVGKCDFIFLPHHLTLPGVEISKGKTLSYCYYTGYAATLIKNALKGGTQSQQEPFISPLIDFENRRKTKEELLTALSREGIPKIDEEMLSEAYDISWTIEQAYRKSLRSSYSINRKRGDISLLLLGRPYTLLSNSMNKGIPRILGNLGVRVFFQDMIPLPGKKELEAWKEEKELLEAFPWYFPATMLQSLYTCVNTPELYPVIVTSFKCSPDSFAVEYCRRILDYWEKPYLILQLDDHDSTVGYETRLEAGIRAFRNHYSTGRTRISREIVHGIFPNLDYELKGKTLVLPNWDQITMPFLAEAIREGGFKVEVLSEDEDSIRRGMSYNTGQCIPLSIIVQEYIDLLQRGNLKPEETLLWIAKAEWPCNIPMFPYYIKTLLDSEGNGIEKTGVYVCDLTFSNLSPLVTLNIYLAYLFGGLLRRLGCRFRPYEKEKGITDRIITQAQKILLETFRGKRDRVEALEEVLMLFEAIPRAGEPRPKVAIIGDFYSRDNDIFNQGLIREIERAGGEAVTTPYSDYSKIVASSFFTRVLKEKEYTRYLKFKTILAFLEIIEKRYYPLFETYLPRIRASAGRELLSVLDRFGVRIEQEGETMDNLLKVIHLSRTHKDLALIIQANPAFCCPSLVTEALSPVIEEVTGIPVVSITYDGTGAWKNDLLAPYLRFTRLKN